MSLKPSGRNTAVLVCIAVVFTIGALFLRAEEPTTVNGVKAQVQALTKMAPEARRAELQKMSPEQRRSLWFELKREKLAAQGKQPLKRGTGLTPRALTDDQKAAARQLATKAGSPGTIRYDEGTPSISFGGGAIIGNRFDTAVGNPIATSGTISTVVGVVVQGPAFTSSSVGFVIEGPQTAGGGANAIFSSWTNAVSGVVDAVTFSGLGVNYTGSSFMVLFGDWAQSYVPAFSSGSTQSQGHHGIVGYTGGTGPNITSTFDFGNTLNALIRVTGNVLPVELMSFEVE